MDKAQGKVCIGRPGGQSRMMQSVQPPAALALPICDAEATPEAAASSASWRRRAAAQLAVAMPELGWSVCEPLFMPLMLSLKVPARFLTICWLCSPVAGLFLHPCVGNLSDRYGRRPFVMAFGVLGAIGLVATPLIAATSRSACNQGGGPCKAAPNEVGVVLTLLAFGVTDVSHDVLMTPTRAAMNDVFDAEGAERRTALASGTGKLFALLCATFLDTSTAFFVVAAVIASATVTQLAVPCDTRVVVARAAQAAIEIPDATVGVAGSNALRAQVHVPSGFWLMWTLQLSSWLSICTFSFYFTSVWAEHVNAGPPGSPGFDSAVRVATGLLVVSTAFFLLAGAALPAIVSACRGEENATIVSLLVLALVLLAFSLAPLQVAAVGVVALVPVAYQVIGNAPFAWLERCPGFDERRRGRLTGWLNSSLAVSQALVALLGGPVVEAAGGRLTTAYEAVAAVDIAVVAGALLCKVRRQINEVPC
mmetsp:Transcript_28205/g.61334  ORF Transcript_28205/g.61334 Transcript_28205/m.61334 type:complete len:479 (+) Transcript_28205:101-1537(+)